jgi:hypothetical protein
VPVASKILIQPVGFAAPVARAAAELEGYLPRLAEVRAKSLAPLPTVPRKSRVHIVLGTSQQLAGLGLGALPRPHDLDDAFAILPKSGTLYLAGSNPRSVLYAAYRLLEELGAVFLRPGPGGEVLPRSKALSLPVQAIREKASYRHRGICIEGSPRPEHVLEVLDWMAKKKMNSFQLQFRHAGVFWRRGFHSPEMEPAVREAPLSEQDCVILDDLVIARMDELGMLLHRVGHGWTAMTLGYLGTEWYEKPDRPLPADRRDWAAEVNGKRELWRGEPSNTELCYSRPEVRAAFVDRVVTYARQHPEVEFLHVWLSDAANNKCECANCRPESPSEWYAVLMGELGERMDAEGLASRVVFLAYNDLLWPPEETRITADRMVMMYAPAGRCYRHIIDDRNCGKGGESKRPALNKSRRPFGNRGVSEIADLWREFDPPDSFLFDYYGWRQIWVDGYGLDLGASVAGDVKALAGLGINGLISCQCTRCFYPTAYFANAMADALWNSRLPVKAHRAGIMKAAFGRHAAAAEKFLADMIALTRRGPSYDHQTIIDEGAALDRTRIKKLASFAWDAHGKLDRLAKSERDDVVKTSIKLLAAHARQTALIADCYLAGMAGDRKRIADLKATYEAWLPEMLGELSLWIDPLVAWPMEQALWRADRIAAKAR